MESKEDKEIPLKKRIKNFFKDNHNLLLVAILIFAFVIRLYYFWLTKNQPLWWDEAEYMSTAKSFAGIVSIDYHLSLNRFPGFPAVVSLFYIIGISNEVVLKFILAFIPSLIVIFLLYILLSSMYSDKRISLISTLILVVLWEHIFYSNRFHTENPSLIFEFLALLVLFGVYIKDKDFYFIKSKHALFWIFLFSVIAILFRSQNIAFVPAVVLFLILINFYKIPDKLRKSSAMAFIIFIILSLVSMSLLSRKFALVNQFYRYEHPIGWNAFSVFYGFYQSLVSSIPSILLYTFLLGTVMVIGSIVIFPEGLKKLNKNVGNNHHKSDIFNLILLTSVLFFFVVMLRTSSFEYRWFFAFLPGMLAFTAKGLISLGDHIQSKIKIKHLSIFIVLLLLFLGVYTQINHADIIIKNKLDSYSQVRESGFWLKESSNPEDIVISGSIFQHAYYSERKIEYPPEEEKDFENLITSLSPRYLVISLYQPLPQWLYNWPERNPGKVTPIKIYYLNNNPQQISAVVYEFNFSNQNEL